MFVHSEVLVTVCDGDGQQAVAASIHQTRIQSTGRKNTDVPKLTRNLKIPQQTGFWRVLPLKGSHDIHFQDSDLVFANQGSNISFETPRRRMRTTCATPEGYVALRGPLRNPDLEPRAADPKYSIV